MSGRRRTVVVFYNARHSLPLRSSNEAHVAAWGRHSRHRVLYVNVGFGVPWPLLERIDIDAVVFDTIFLSMHWDPVLFDWRAGPCRRLREWTCPKIAVVQDEFMNMSMIVDFLRDVGITHVLSCAEPEDWPKIYRGLDLERVRFRTALTGYVDERRRIGAFRPHADRPIDIGYRAWNNPFWLGVHGRRKVEIGQVVGAAARRRGFAVDINALEAQDFLIGDRWFDFLSSCRTVLGVEGGASVLDWDGTIRERVERHVKDHPDATFEETREACFPGQDGYINLACLSPRNFEAAATRTCQILLEGRYNGVFEPWRHYIPVKRDYSNLVEVFEALADKRRCAEIAERCHADVIASGRWSYERFIRAIEAEAIDPAPANGRGGPADWIGRALLSARETMVTRFAAFEAASRSRPPTAWRRFLLAQGRLALDLG